MNLSLEERHTRSANLKALRKDPDFDKRLRASLVGYGAKVSAQNVENWKDPAYRETQIRRLKALQPRLEETKRQRKLQFWKSPERRAEQAERSRANWRNPLLRDQMTRSLAAAFADREKPSGVHVRLKHALDERLPGFRTHVAIGPYVVDEAHTSKKIAVEVNGCYWHVCSEHFRPREISAARKRTMSQDRRKTSYLERHGWMLVVVWEHDVNNDLEGCVSKVQQVFDDRMP
jgi:DNA mismatch endonuclease, patch repair protein